MRYEVPTIAHLVISVVSMTLVAIVGASVGVAIFSDPLIQEIVLGQTAKLWESKTFLRVNQWLGIV